MNISGFTKGLQEFHAKVAFTVTLEVTVLAHSSLSASAQIEFRDDLDVQLIRYGDELDTVRENVKAARQLESRSIDAAKAAENLVAMLDRALIAD